MYYDGALDEAGATELRDSGLVVFSRELSRRDCPLPKFA